MQIQEAATAPGEVKADLSALRSSITALHSALAMAEGPVAESADEVFEAVREVGIDSLVRLTREGSEEGMQLLGLLYFVMQQSASKGVTGAGKLASTIARSLGEAGYSIQSDCNCKH
jgi:hypothetical protein